MLIAPLVVTEMRACYGNRRFLSCSPKTPPLVHVPSHIHAFPSCFFKIYLYVTPLRPKSLSLRFHTKVDDALFFPISAMFSVCYSSGVRMHVAGWQGSLVCWQTVDKYAVRLRYVRLASEPPSACGNHQSAQGNVHALFGLFVHGDLPPPPPPILISVTLYQLSTNELKETLVKGWGN
jgi:hypothetical protein